MASADEAYVFNITRQEYVMQNLFHPHSVTVLDGEVWVCESSRLSAVTSSGTRIQKRSGYLRGLCRKGPFVCCGSTVGRRQSKSTGRLIDNRADPGLLAGHSGIQVIDHQARRPVHNGFIDLTKYTDEIYDVVPASEHV